MTEYKVNILGVREVTHDVRQLVLERPQGYTFEAGQATEVSIDDPKWRDEKRPFTFTGFEDDRTLELTFKVYPEHHGVTEAMGKLKKGDRLILRDVWGAIGYKGEGAFIAGGAGITPFIAIFRKLHKEGRIGGNKLIFSNKTKNDVILEAELTSMLGNKLDRVFTRERVDGCHFGRIDANYLRSYLDGKQHVYICGPDPFVEAMKKLAIGLGAKPDSVVVEQ